jgi:hypothetical protein
VRTRHLPAIISLSALVLLTGWSTVSGPTAGHSPAASGAPISRYNPNVESQHGVPSVILPALQRAIHPPRQFLVRPRKMSDLAHGVVYTGQYYGNDVSIYQKNDVSLTYAESLSSGFVNPQGVGTTLASPSEKTTTKGTWYIANTGAGDIPVYASTRTGPMGPIETLLDSGQYPVDVDASAAVSLVAVSNNASASYGPGTVSLYAHGSTIATGTLRVSDYAYGMGVAIDNVGNCFWSYFDASLNQGAIAEFPSCTGSATTVVSGLGYPGGIAFDKKNNLYYTDQAAGILYRCEGTASCVPITTGFGDPVFVNFDQGWSNLWVADATGYVDAINPLTGAVESVTAGEDGASDPPVGVAAAPSARY